MHDMHFRLVVLMICMVPAMLCGMQQDGYQLIQPVQTIKRLKQICEQTIHQSVLDTSKLPSIMRQAIDKENESHIIQMYRQYQETENGLGLSYASVQNGALIDHYEPSRCNLKVKCMKRWHNLRKFTAGTAMRVATTATVMTLSGTASLIFSCLKSDTCQYYSGELVVLSLPIFLFVSMAVLRLVHAMDLWVHNPKNWPLHHYSQVVNV